MRIVSVAVCSMLAAVELLGQALTVTPSAVSFTAQEGGPAPVSQTITVSGLNGSLVEVVPSLGLISFLTASVGGSSVLTPYGQPVAIITVPAIITVGVIWPPQPADVLGYYGSIELYQFDPSTGDTSIGLKGRIVFECPGLTALLTAHRALEEAVLSAHQNAFKPTVAQKWVELVYKGFFFEPLKRDLEAFLQSSQAHVSGEVALETQGGVCHAVSVVSDHVLLNKKAVYAQSADWSADEAEGFIKLFGQSSTLSARINPVYKL